MTSLYFTMRQMLLRFENIPEQFIEVDYFLKNINNDFWLNVIRISFTAILIAIMAVVKVFQDNKARAMAIREHEALEAALAMERELPSAIPVPLETVTMGFPSAVMPMAIDTQSSSAMASNQDEPESTPASVEIGSVAESAETVIHLPERVSSEPNSLPVFELPEPPAIGIPEHATPESIYLSKESESSVPEAEVVEHEEEAIPIEASAIFADASAASVIDEVPEELSAQSVSEAVEEQPAIPVVNAMNVEEVVSSSEVNLANEELLKEQVEKLFNVTSTLKEHDARISQAASVLDEHEERIGEFTSSISEQESRINAMSGVMNSQSEKINSISGILNSHTEKIDTLLEESTEISDKLDALIVQFADSNTNLHTLIRRYEQSADELDSLYRKGSVLSEKFASVQKNVDAFSGRLDLLHTNFNILSDNVSAYADLKQNERPVRKPALSFLMFGKTAQKDKAIDDLRYISVLPNLEAQDDTTAAEKKQSASQGKQKTGTTIPSLAFVLDQFAASSQKAEPAKDKLPEICGLFDASNGILSRNGENPLKKQDESVNKPDNQDVGRN